MKPFFTLLVSNDLTKLSEFYEKSNKNELLNTEKKVINNAVVYYRKAKNPAMSVDIVGINESNNEFVFGFGTMVSKEFGIIGDDFSEVAPKIFTKYGTLKNDLVNGVYAGIEFKGNEVEIFNDFFGLSVIFYSKTKSGDFIVSNSFEHIYRLNLLLENNVEWNNLALTEYLSLGKNISGNTLIESIKLMLPANVIKIKNNQFVTENYRTFPEDSSLKINFKDMVEASYMEFKNSVSRLYKDKYKYCFSISGGTDSRLVYFEWPNKAELLTETYGNEDNSDTLKAKELVRRHGNIKLHEMEQDYAEKYSEGIFKYFDNIDYVPMAGDDNFYHLDWKVSRGANVRFGGTDGELLGGENMYLSRKPWYVIKEGFLPYSYKKLNSDDVNKKEELVSNMFYRNYKTRLLSLLSEDKRKNDFFKPIVKSWDIYIGKCDSPETYIERFRMWYTVVEHNYHFQNFYMDTNSHMTPFQDYVLTELISKTNPRLRELRKLEIAVLKKYNLSNNLPLDTTHLKTGRPYIFHKFFRMMRFAMNIGYSMKVPFVQKGTPLKTTIPAFYDPNNQEFRKIILDKIKSISILDRERIEEFVAPYYSINGYNHFSATHEGWPNLFVLLKLATFEERLGKLKREVEI